MFRDQRSHSPSARKSRMYVLAWLSTTKRSCVLFIYLLCFSLPDLSKRYSIDFPPSADLLSVGPGNGTPRLLLHLFRTPKQSVDLAVIWRRVIGNRHYCTYKLAHNQMQRLLVDIALDCCCTGGKASSFVRSITFCVLHRSTEASGLPLGLTISKLFLLLLC